MDAVVPCSREKAALRSDSVEYAVEQGKKVAQVVADSIEKLIKKD